MATNPASPAVEAAPRAEEAIAAIRPERDFSLPPDFWSHFARHHWTKAPLCLKQAFSGSVITPEEAFPAMVCASDRFRAGDNVLRVRFYVGQTLVVSVSEVVKLLPCSDDGSLQGYAERINRQLEGQEFELVLNTFQEYSPELWLRLREFCRGLYGAVGIPARRIDTSMFLRNHRKTSFGVHKDQQHVFMFVVEGDKRMLTWPEEVFRDRHERFSSQDYERYVDQAIVLDGAPGDVLFWPSSYWHVGEAAGAQSVGGLSLTLSLAIDISHQPVNDVIEHLKGMVQDRLGQAADAFLYPFDPDCPQRIAEALPPTLELALETVRQAVQDVELEQALRLAWLNRLTAYGFTHVPPPREKVILDDEAIVQGHPNDPILWLPWSIGLIAVSAHGHSFSVPAYPDVLKLLDRLNTGEAVRVKVLLHGCKEVAGTDFLRNLLEKLYTFRAVEPIIESS